MYVNSIPLPHAKIMGTYFDCLGVEEREGGTGSISHRVYFICLNITTSELLIWSPLIVASQAELSRVEVVYETFPGWKTSISGARSFTDLPKNAQAYITRLEELLHIPG